MLKSKGPFIIAANHPNSFLDAIILASVFQQPIYSLARGDAFVSPFINRLLHSLHILPVYRLSEGAENLGNNYDTFDQVQELLKEKKIVLIFSEGLSVKEWHLRPLKKGTARIALRVWEEGSEMEVIPVGINYSSFNRFAKSIIINIGTPIRSASIGPNKSGRALNSFNAILYDELSLLVYEIPKEETTLRKKIFEKPVSLKIAVLLAIPSFIGYLLHAPFYYLCRSIVQKKISGHYDSVMVGAAFVFYPFYLLLVTSILYFVTGSWWSLILIPLMPLTALALLHTRKVV